MSLDVWTFMLLCVQEVHNIAKLFFLPLVRILLTFIKLKKGIRKIIKQSSHLHASENEIGSENDIFFGCEKGWKNVQSCDNHD